MGGAREGGGGEGGWLGFIWGGWRWSSSNPWNSIMVFVNATLTSDDLPWSVHQERSIDYLAAHQDSLGFLRICLGSWLPFFMSSLGPWRVMSRRFHGLVLSFYFDWIFFDGSWSYFRYWIRLGDSQGSFQICDDFFRGCFGGFTAVSLLVEGFWESFWGLKIRKDFFFFFGICFS